MSRTYISSNKKSVQILIEYCYTYGIKHIITSPGSRNAPLIISFDNHPEFTCYSIPDERSAAFYALGMARQLNNPVAIVCTSGTALLNYYPAITEAYYQNIPIIIISADRPQYMIDQEDGQTIRQYNVFTNHIHYSANIPLDKDIKGIKKEFKKAFLNLKNNGPIHLNIPFEEPLYETERIKIKNKKLINSTINNINYTPIDNLIKAINNNNKIMLLAGVTTPNDKLNNVINKLSKYKNILIIAPSTSNLNGEDIINTPDLLFKTISKTKFIPNILITIGGPVISKHIKQFLRDIKELQHYDIDDNTIEVNTYFSLKEKINISPITALEYIYKNINTNNSEFKKIWLEENKKIKKQFYNFIKKIKWCDISIFDNILNNINTKIDLHLANSTPVRYIELFDKKQNINYYTNRGTSGIDGSLSTTAGAALINNKPTLIITGDMSFAYDSNVFWNRHIPNNFKIILINNSGGNIFKIISGARDTKQLQNFFKTTQNINNKMICKAFNIKYYSAKSKNKLLKLLPEIINNNQCSVLELFTDSTTNQSVFDRLNNNFIK